MSEADELVGVVTEWDFTRSSARDEGCQQSIGTIMSRQVISAGRKDKILEVIRKLEHYEISAMPVVEAGEVLGVISADLLARRSLPRLLQSQVE